MGGSGRRLRAAASVRQRREGELLQAAAWREAPRLGVQVGSWAPLLGVTWRGQPPHAHATHPGALTLGSPPAPQPRAGEHQASSPRVALLPSGELPHGTALFLAGLVVGWTDRQTETLVAGCLVTG